MSQIKVDQITDEAGTGAPDFPNGVEVGGQTLLMPANSLSVTLSGSSVDFTGIPAAARRVTVMLNGLSTNGTNIPSIQLGNAGGIETSGYIGATGVLIPAGSQAANFSTGVLFGASWGAAAVLQGAITFDLMDSDTNLWVISGVAGRSDSTILHFFGGSKILSQPLTQVRLTTNGANIFDAGTASASWE